MSSSQVQEEQGRHDLNVRPATVSNGEVLPDRLHESGHVGQLEVERQTTQGGEPVFLGVDFVLDGENAL